MTHQPQLIPDQPTPEQAARDVERAEYLARLREKLKDPEWAPDEGPAEFNPKAGATVTGARFPLIAFNVNLRTGDL